MIVARFPLYVVRCILHASHFRTMGDDKRVYLATLSNGGVIAWTA